MAKSPSLSSAPLSASSEPWQPAPSRILCPGLGVGVSRAGTCPRPVCAHHSRWLPVPANAWGERSSSSAELLSAAMGLRGERKGHKGSAFGKCTRLMDRLIDLSVHPAPYTPLYLSFSQPCNGGTAPPPPRPPPNGRGSSISMACLLCLLKLLARGLVFTSGAGGFCDMDIWSGASGLRPAPSQTPGTRGLVDKALGNDCTDDCQSPLRL